MRADFSLSHLNQTVPLLSARTLYYNRKPGPRALCAFDIAGTLFISVILVMMAQLGCPTITIYKGPSSFQGRAATVHEPMVLDHANLTCNAQCHCHDVAYSPVCSSDGKMTFFSACEAGCRYT